ncbi:hypothetical protein GCM10022631_25740 [Deinococcus rubellus]|uniref:hypothetical protein n=1 Tax=Deinococcus rubellus TaxID=1889240 RepID=UPI0031F0A418
MSAAERPPPQTTNPPTTLKPQPKVSRWAYVLIVIGALSLFDLIGLDNWGTPLVMIVIGVSLIMRPYSWGRPLTLGLVTATLLAVGGWYVLRPAVPAPRPPKPSDSPSRRPAPRLSCLLPLGSWTSGRAAAAR